MRILLVDDNHDAIANMSDFLELHDHQVDIAYHGEAALQCIKSFSFDVIVLDIMMPVMDGLTACQQIRQLTETPIIFVTARDTLEDKLEGFRVGADDYLVKPFALPEMLARVEVIHARASGQHKQMLSFGALAYDLSKDEVRHHNAPIALDPTQKQLLKLLLNHAPAIVNSRDMAYAIWQEEDIDSSALRTQIYRLRKSLPDGMLVTVRGKGYRLSEQHQ
ncbi:response regulator transcription factor [Thaumasiovibrio subtropicus]|uniref:response regulator transcription factor n=1 Tax=Thaumasiovibrio subtropicus TaxID=1891207 RepID=UPI000B34CC39|nr:response regulator transcription factor [Thaumasiovibrio subtropicus]